MSDALRPLDLEALERDRMKDLRAAEVAATLQSTHRGGAHPAAFAHDIRDAGVELTRARSAEAALVAEVKRLREALEPFAREWTALVSLGEEKKHMLTPVDVAACRRAKELLP